MRWQRIMFQTKEQAITLEEQLSEMEIGNLPKKEFRIMIVKIIQDLREKKRPRRYKKCLTKKRSKEQTVIIIQ